ncbi:hypothetical protein [Alcanivorax sp.]|uniref:hypothetical protein n=1 Tax=Alcanivorax sp. TaxID=1872427 RepID=UPI003BAC7B65
MLIAVVGADGDVDFTTGVAVGLLEGHVEDVLFQAGFQVVAVQYGRAAHDALPAQHLEGFQINVFRFQLELQLFIVVGPPQRTQ